jgi:hypothetical protein
MQLPRWTGITYLGNATSGVDTWILYIISDEFHQRDELRRSGTAHVGLAATLSGGLLFKAV